MRPRARWATKPSLVSGGDSGARTRNLRLAKPALSQLSYIPETGPARVPGKAGAGAELEALVGLGGLEPPTSRLSGVRSNQLSYRPTARRDAIEPVVTVVAPTVLPRPGTQWNPGLIEPGQDEIERDRNRTRSTPISSSRREKNSARTGKSGRTT